jgi:threonyl-tRNA synthetase
VPKSGTTHTVPAGPNSTRLGRPHERFVGFLIEHCAGNFPFWLSPEQVGVLPIGDEGRLRPVPTSSKRDHG